MAFIYNKLRGKIKEVFGTQSAFAEAMELSSVTISARLNNGVEFSQTEIMKAVDILNIDPAEIRDYFFTPEVQKTEQK